MPEDPKKPIEIIPGRVEYAPDYKSGPSTDRVVVVGAEDLARRPTIDENDAYRRSRDLAVAAQERARIVAWMRSFTQNKHAQEWAGAIERHEDKKERP